MAASERRLAAIRNPGSTKNEGIYSLVSNPTPHRDTAPAHAAHETARQALSPGPLSISVRIVHGNWFGAPKRVLPGPPVGIVAGATHHGGGSRVFDTVVISGLLSL